MEEYQSLGGVILTHQNQRPGRDLDEEGMQCIWA